MIELSIVIVIIGILVGGVVLGSKVMERARLAKVSSELSQIKQAFMMFDDTYISVPGDYLVLQKVQLLVTLRLIQKHQMYVLEMVMVR